MTGIYDAAQAYEIGFSYRDIPAEVDAVLAFYALHRDGLPDSVLDLAAGPSDHALELAGRGIEATALDLNPAMCRRAADRAASRGIQLSVVRGDMQQFELSSTYDLAICLIDSIAYLPDLDALLGHLGAVSDHLKPGGLYVVESAHPADIFGADSRTITEWSVHRDGVTVQVRWGDPDTDVADPVRQSTLTRISFTVTTAEGTTEVSELTPQRWWTATELAAAGRLAGLQVVGRYGAFDPSVPLESDQAWRMLTVYAASRPTGTMTGARSPHCQALPPGVEPSV